MSLMQRYLDEYRICPFQQDDAQQFPNSLRGVEFTR